MIDIELLKRFYTLINEVASLPRVPGSKDPQDLADDLLDTVHKIVLQVDRSVEPSSSKRIVITTSETRWTVPPEVPPTYEVVSLGCSHDAEELIARQARNATVMGRPQLQLINGGKQCV